MVISCLFLVRIVRLRMINFEFFFILFSWQPEFYHSMNGAHASVFANIELAYLESIRDNSSVRLVNIEKRMLVKNAWKKF